EMEKEDPAIVTKALASNFDDFITKLSSYVKITWIKYGLECVMNKNGFFFFKFSTRDGMERVIENGPWLIRSFPLILNIWTPNAQVKKDEIKMVPIWVKLHHVPVGKSHYARALIQVSADKALPESVVVSIPFFMVRDIPWRRLKLNMSRRP
ncbi:zinc knuckle CX2CX4HX4C containing protein, partial [Tanacetum coccineum]